MKFLKQFFMKTFNEEKYGNLLIRTFVNPGSELSDFAIKAVFRDILAVNANRSQPIVHKLLASELTLNELRQVYASSVVGIIYSQGQPAGFLISPVLKVGSRIVVHAGLVVISRNHGDNLLGLLSINLVKTIARKFGQGYITNISSTPSILESFANLVAKPWPDPDARLVKPPKGYRDVFNLLYNSYILNYFPNPQDVHCDQRRFVISSKSLDMGFNTSLRELSRSSNFKYMNFCFTWLDYAKQEDIVQVARFNLWVGIKAFLYSSYLHGVFMLARPPQQVHASKDPRPTPQSLEGDNTVPTYPHAGNQ